MMFRPMPLLTLLSVVSVGILLMLGNWQYARYSEKLNVPALDAADDSVSELSLRVMTEHAGNLQLVNGMADGEFIWRRYVPATVEGSDEIVLALLDATGGIEKRPGPISGSGARLQYAGRLVPKAAEPGWFGQADQPLEDTWYRVNAAKMGAHLGLAEIRHVAEPVQLTITNAVDATRQRVTLNPYARAKPIDPLPPERHFGYALTWWGMALGLLGVYIALHSARGRLRFRKEV